LVVVPYLVCTGGGCRLQCVNLHMSGCRISGSLTKTMASTSLIDAAARAFYRESEN
jgi:hypothetical protein